MHKKKHKIILNYLCKLYIKVVLNLMIRNNKKQFLQIRVFIKFSGVLFYIHFFYIITEKIISLK